MKQEEKWFAAIKNELIEVVQQVSLADSELAEQVLISSYPLIEAFQKLSDRKILIPDNLNGEESHLTMPQETTTYSRSMTTPEPIQKMVADSTTQNPKGYALKRLVRGGTLSEVNLFVSESTIRKQGLSHGDLLGYNVVDPQNPYPNKRCRFYLVEKVNPPLDDGRVQVDKGIVEKWNDKLIVRYVYAKEGQLFLENNVEKIFYINEVDAEKYKVVPGSMVDLAFMKDKPEEVRVLYCYEEKDPKPSTC